LAPSRPWQNQGRDSLFASVYNFRSTCKNPIFKKFLAQAKRDGRLKTFEIFNLDKTAKSLPEERRGKVFQAVKKPNEIFFLAVY
jgi:hypothetical protein